MRLELPDGQWAEVRDRINHGQDKALKVAYNRGKEDVALRVEFDTVLIRTFVTSWFVKDVETGAPIDLDDPTGIDRVADGVADAIAEAAADIWAGRTSPNAPTPPSSASSS